MARKRRKIRKKAVLLICLIAAVLCGVLVYVQKSRKQDPYDENWQLILVNSTHPIDADYDPPLLTLDNGEQVDERMYPYLQDMFDAARAQGIELYVRSGYRSYEEQKELYESQYQSYLDQGYGEEEAEEMTLAYTAAPGCSEHETGLAVDINTENDNISEETAQWLNENAWQYGFIRRYADDKADLTGVSNEPWHYRYVGKDAAQYMYENNLCLEEYLDQ